MESGSKSTGVASSPRRKVKILIPVWGKRYIRRFGDLGLSSGLASGNLPALAETCDVELVFLTCAKDFSYFEALPVMAAVRRFAAIRYEPIDDLVVPGLYSVTLTLSYMRGMRIFGQAMTDIYFIYWNADFILGDGAYAHLARCIAEGRPMALAGSLRVIAEEAEPILRSWKAPDGVLEVEPRRLCELAFRHPHLMQSAKTVNDGFSWAAAPNHMFWTVGEDAVIARFFQIFMFCIKPQRVLETIDGYCDYSFVPAFCPGEPIHVVQDSDDVCLLELQKRDQEAEDVHFGPERDYAWRRSIEEWQTPEHAAIARKPILYHAGEPPISLTKRLRESDRYIDRLMKGARRPSPHPGHYYWTYGVAAWRLRRSERQTRLGWPPELDLTLPVRALHHPSFEYYRDRLTLRRARAGAGASATVRRLLAGTLPDVRPLNSNAPALRPLVAQAWSIRKRLDQRPNHRILVVADLGGWIDLILPPDHPRLYRTETLIAATWLLKPDPPVDEMVVWISDPSRPDLERVLKNAMSAIKPSGAVTVLSQYNLSDSYQVDPSVADARMFAVSTLHDKRMEFHAADRRQALYARAVARLLPQWNERSLRRRLRVRVAFLATLMRRTIGPGRGQSAAPAAAVLRGKTPPA